MSVTYLHYSYVKRKLLFLRIARTSSFVVENSEHHLAKAFSLHSAELALNGLTPHQHKPPMSNTHQWEKILPMTIRHRENTHGTEKQLVAVVSRSLHLSARITY